MKIVTLNVASRPNSKLLKTYLNLKIDPVKTLLPIKTTLQTHHVDSTLVVSTWNPRGVFVGKMNVNYKSDNNKNKIHWQIATSRSKYVHSSKVESNTFERNRKFNDIHFELSKMFSLLYNDDQNLTTKRPTSTIPSMPEKIPADSRNTSLHVTSTVQNKRPPVCTTKNYLKRLVSI